MDGQACEAPSDVNDHLRKKKNYTVFGGKTVLNFTLGDTR